MSPSWCYLRTILAIAMIAVVWALLYLPNLRSSPGWYGDETLTLMIGNALYAGQPSDRALAVTFWHPSYAYQPLYAWMVGLFSSLTNGDILGGRLMNVLLALTTALIIFGMGREIMGEKPALFGSLVFLTYEQTIIHFRWIYSHNGVALGFVVSVLALVRASSIRANAVAGCGLAWAAFCHPLFTHGCLGALACRLKKPSAWPFLIIPPLAVVAATVSWTLFRTWPESWLLDDIRLLGDFYASFSRENGGLLQSARNIYNFYTQDLFHMLAVACIAVCAARKYYAVAIFAAAVSGMLLQNRQNLPVFYYQAVVFLPVLAVAFAGALNVISARLRLSIGRKANYFVTGVFILPATMFLVNAPKSWHGSFVPRNQPWVTQDVSEVELAAEWLNEHTDESDLVICHQNIGWLLHARTADLMQVTAHSGLPTFTFEKPVPQSRFLYPAKIEEAKYVVIADIDQRWTLGQPNTLNVVRNMETQMWPIVWRAQHYVIVSNPNLSQSP